MFEGSKTKNAISCQHASLWKALLVGPAGLKMKKCYLTALVLLSSDLLNQGRKILGKFTLHHTPLLDILWPQKKVFSVNTSQFSGFSKTAEKTFFKFCRRVPEVDKNPHGGFVNKICFWSQSTNFSQNSKIFQFCDTFSKAFQSLNSGKIRK